MTKSPPWRERYITSEIKSLALAAAIFGLFILYRWYSINAYGCYLRLLAPICMATGLLFLTNNAVISFLLAVGLACIFFDGPETAVIEPVPLNGVVLML